MDVDRQYTQASLATADSLGSIARSADVRQLTRLTLPEIEAAIDLVARMIPAGNVPGVILSGLTRLPGRRLPPQTARRDINLLFKGIEQALNTAMYGAFFAGPAAVIWGYQYLLRLAGKDPDDAFPEGAWQFYVEYALRDDTARHANETHGFDTALKQHDIRLSAADRLTAWALAAIHCLHQYDALLENEWRERVYIRLLRAVTRKDSDAARYARLYRDWETQRPYTRGSDAAPDDDYPTCRRRKFDLFLDNAMHGLRDGLRREWRKQIRDAESRDLPAYRRQLSILAYLESGAHDETRAPIKLAQACVGVIHQERYYLIPACAPGSTRPPDAASVRAQIAALMRRPDSPATPLVSLAGLKRAALASLRPKLNTSVAQSLDALRLAPILLNCDRRPRDLPLSELRQAERGVGDHALTLFDTGETIVFDQSHIFFDGTWGAALAEIMTNEALAWAVYLNSLPLVQPADDTRPTAEGSEGRPGALALQLQPSERALARNLPHVAIEATAETDGVNVKAILALRKIFKQRSDLLQISVNDLLVLYRAIHAATYQPDARLLKSLQDLTRDKATRQAAQAALEAIDASRKINPSILIPVDASQRAPRDRLYPLSFEVPLSDLDLLGLHRRAIAALDAYRRPAGDPATAYVEFDKLQRAYLATLAAFGAVSAKAKAIAVTGESASVGTIKLLAHMPAAVQRLLDGIPGRFDMLNDLIKGREVISNVGAIAPGSTLTRFMTAKDDNEKKTLAWGVLTDAGGVMRITLRDFRPHAGLLAAAGRKELAVRLTQDYLDAYARGLNDFVRDLQHITLTSRETRAQG